MEQFMNLNSSFCRLFVATVLACGSTWTFAQNSLTNSGFESGNLTGWNSGSGGVITTAQAHGGTYSLAAFGTDYVSQSFAAVSVSDIDELSFWVKRTDGPLNLFSFRYSDGTSGSTLIDAFGESNDWMKFDVQPLLDVSKSLVGIQVYGTTSGPAYLDDLKLVVTAVPEAETFAMMLVGLALIGSVVRRRKTA